MAQTLREYISCGIAAVHLAATAVQTLWHAASLEVFNCFAGGVEDLQLLALLLLSQLV
jgi:hypothetical protein